MRAVARVGVVIAALLLVLTGCTERSSVVREPPGSGQPGATQTRETQPSADPATAASQQALAAQKKKAGIADCPASDASVGAVDGGLPDVVLSCLGGGRAVHLAGLRGRPMMVNVWAQWCPPCREEAPYLSEVAKDNSSDLVILGVDFVDPQPGKAIEFAQYSGWKYPQLADTDKVLGAPLQILGPPSTFFVRADGTVAARHSGPFTSADQIRTLARQHLGVDL
jgi:cytochrome c biogenesis protein CcmG/thiol:disulfide interchange protein DsbE